MKRRCTGHERRTHHWTTDWVQQRTCQPAAVSRCSRPPGSGKPPMPADSGKPKVSTAQASIGQALSACQCAHSLAGPGADSQAIGIRLATQWAQDCSPLGSGSRTAWLRLTDVRAEGCRPLGSGSQTTCDGPPPLRSASACRAPPAARRSLP
eukprot:366268-Chlamydomonas_euryale.AAC.6